MEKIRVTSTLIPKYFTVGKEYKIIERRDISDDGYECDIVIVVDDEGDKFAICNQQEATYELV